MVPVIHNWVTKEIRNSAERNNIHIIFKKNLWNWGNVRFTLIATLNHIKRLLLGLFYCTKFKFTDFGLTLPGERMENSKCEKSASLDDYVNATIRHFLYPVLCLLRF